LVLCARRFRGCGAARGEQAAGSIQDGSAKGNFVPFGAFMPDRAFVPGSTNPNNNISTVDLPVNVGVIKCGTELILYDTGWKQQDYRAAA
jgi:hypothetical protein